MRIGLLCSNFARIGPSTKKGTEVFCYILAKSLAHRADRDLDVTMFASGDSRVALPVESITPYDLMGHEFIPIGYHANFENAHISEAFAKQVEFDLYHAHIGCGEMIIPYAPFVRKPIIITMHGTTLLREVKEYFSRVTIPENVHFVSISNAQRKPVPHLPYIRTIYHGIDARRTFTFDKTGGEQVIWAGRAIPDKGLDVVVDVMRHMKKPVTLCMRTVTEELPWLQSKVLGKIRNMGKSAKFHLEFDLTRSALVERYQKSKVFLFPIMWGEPFGLVIIEAMATGTPVIAYARGSAPEIICDGETGFLVNPSANDIRGNFIVKKSGKAGLQEALERIYAMPKNEYVAMRHRCRDEVLGRFTVERMVDEYVDLYRRLAVSSRATSYTPLTHVHGKPVGKSNDRNR